MLLHPTDHPLLNRLAPVAKSVLERAGFKVDMQAMDWQSVLTRAARREPASSGGWGAYATSFGGVDQMEPISLPYIAANCEKARPGWPCDAQIETLRDQFVAAADAARRKALAVAIQVRAAEYGTHVPLGESTAFVTIRKSVAGVVEAPATVFWNIEKAGR